MPDDVITSYSIHYTKLYEKALEAITINPAKICGIDNRVGSISPGKDADLCIFNGDPLNLMSSPEIVFIDGKRIN